MVSGKEKSRNLINFLRIKKGLKKKKKTFEFSTLVVNSIDACIRRDHEQCGGFGTTTTTTGGVVGGGLKKKKRNIRDLIQTHPAQMCSEPDDDDAWSVVQERALVQALKDLIPKGKDVIVTNQRCWEQVATAVPGKKMTAIQCKKKFALLVKKGVSFN